MSATNKPQRSEQRVPQRLALRTGTNRFDFDHAIIPDDMVYEWKRKSIYGQEDVEHLINLDANGWSPVPAERHPELMGRRAVLGGEIVRGGMILMERPKELSEEARDLDTFAAKNQVATQLQRLGLEGKRAAGRGIKTTYAPGKADEAPE